MAVSRFRIDTDGKGVNTLVAFYGCPLKCKYCINPECHNKDTVRVSITPERLYKELSKDDFYYTETGGGVVFGGGEPLIHSEYILNVIKMMPEEWNVRIETSLNVDWSLIEPLINHVDEWIIDIKDVNSLIYRKYTGMDNEMVKANLQKLSQNTSRDKLRIRIPIIPGYNGMNNVNRSKTEMSKYTDNIDVFEYKCENAHVNV